MKQAFTLIELLVVITITAVLAALTIVGLNSIREKSRDVVRVSDAKQIQTALAVYFSDHNAYPATLTTGQPLVGSNGTTYLKKVPQDPQISSGTDYSYAVDPGYQDYTLSYQLRGTVNEVGPGTMLVTANSGGGGTLQPPPPDSCGGVTSVDYGGESYATVSIGTQCWLTENLNVGTRIDNCTGGACAGANCGTTCAGRTPGASINSPTDTTMPDPSNPSTIEKYCYDDLDANCTSYGALYTWAEALALANACNTSNSGGCTWTGNKQGICPSGWHVASDCEWLTLEYYLDPTNNIVEPNPGTNCYASGQTGTGGTTGYRGTDAGTKLKAGGSSNLNLSLNGYSYGGYKLLNSAGRYFTASHYSTTGQWYRMSTSTQATSYRAFGNKNNYSTTPLGFAVRCLKD